MWGLLVNGIMGMGQPRWKIDGFTHDQIIKMVFFHLKSNPEQIANIIFLGITCCYAQCVLELYFVPVD